MNDDVQYLSQNSYNNLQAEMEALKNKVIPEIAKKIDEAKQQGDLSENAEYHQAREEMSWAQGRLMELQQILSNAHIIKKNKDSNTVSLGHKVIVEINGAEREYTIVGPQEIDLTQGFISNVSPIGEALLGHEAGDKVEVITPGGKQIYKIIAIK
jgi:transcription elongation factor GreA